MNKEKLINDIVAWLKSEAKKAHSNGLIVGLSGGVDSSVVAHLIKRAFPENSLGVILPIKSSESSLEDARKLVAQSEINSLTIDLTSIHEDMIGLTFTSLQSKNLFNEKYKVISDANLRARLRMSTLYTIANNLGYMVVGTDNKDEYFTGYFTKYGDGASDLLPLAEIYKSEVYEMARFFNIPESIINKAPSADLWENQTDEDEMGVKYSEIEKYIKGEDIDEKSKSIIRKLHLSSEHKRNIPPIFKPQ